MKANGGTGQNAAAKSQALSFGRCFLIFLAVDVVLAVVRTVWVRQTLGQALSAFLLGAVTSVIFAAIFAAASRNRINT